MWVHAPMPRYMDSCAASLEMSARSDIRAPHCSIMLQRRVAVARGKLEC
jgi:hypothetical protein